MIELDEQLREAGERWRDGERGPVADFARVTASPPGSRLPRRSWPPLVAAVAAVAIVVVSAVMLLGGGDSSPRKVVVTPPTTASTTAPDPPSELTLDPEIMQTGALAIDGSSVWVTGDAPGSHAATLEHIDTATGKVVGKVVLGDNGPFQIAVANRAVWVASQQNEESAHITKVDPETMKITAVIETAGDASIAVTPDALWVDVNSGTLLRLDPDTNQVLATITLPGAGYSAHWIAAGPLGIFLSNNYDGTILRVDPATNTVSQFADVGDTAGAIIQLDGSLWVNSGSSVLFELDPTTGAVRRRFDLGLHMQGLFAFSDGRSLWMRTDGPRVARVDPKSGGMTPVNLPENVKYVAILAADSSTGAVWVAVDEPTPRVLRVAPVT